MGRGFSNTKGTTYTRGKDGSASSAFIFVTVVFGRFPVGNGRAVLGKRAKYITLAGGAPHLNEMKGVGVLGRVV